LIMICENFPPHCLFWLKWPRTFMCLPTLMWNYVFMLWSRHSSYCNVFDTLVSNNHHLYISNPILHLVPHKDHKKLHNIITFRVKYFKFCSDMHIKHTTLIWNMENQLWLWMFWVTKNSEEICLHSMWC